MCLVIIPADHFAECCQSAQAARQEYALPHRAKSVGNINPPSHRYCISNILPNAIYRENLTDKQPVFLFFGTIPLLFMPCV